MTANRLTPYAKAVAIEQYLSHTYPYSLEKPTNPSRNEDFVSHFLFVDRTGYCDHFSTAMVVMLRSVGVPARWVKGFAPGTLQASSDDDGLPRSYGSQSRCAFVGGGLFSFYGLGAV